LKKRLIEEPVLVKPATNKSSPSGSDKGLLVNKGNKKNYNSFNHTENEELKTLGVSFDDEELSDDEQWDEHEKAFMREAENESATPESDFFTIFKRMSYIAVPMGLSFTFSFEVFFSVLFLQRLSESDDDTAAATLVSIWMNTVGVLFLSPLFAVSIDLSHKMGMWQEAKKGALSTTDNHTIQVIDEMDEQEPFVEEYTPDTTILSTIPTLKEKIEMTNINSLLIASALTIPAFLGFYYAEPIMINIFHQDEAVAHSAAKFLRLYALAVPGLLFRGSFQQILFGLGKTTPAMCIGLACLSVGTAFSALLGFDINIGPFEFSKMGSEGVAWGFILESYLMAISCGFFIKKSCAEFDFYRVSFDRIKRNLQGLKELLRVGGSITFTVAIELALTLAVGIFSGLLGTESQSAMAYCMQFIYFEFIILAAFAFSCSQEVSRELGANNIPLAQAVAKQGLVTTLIYITPLSLLFSVYPQLLEAISGGASDEISDMLKILVPIMSTGVILDAARYNLLQQTRALNDFFVPNVMALVGMTSGIGIAAALGFETSLGIYGVGAGYTLGIGITGLALLVRWMSKLNGLTETPGEIDLEKDMASKEATFLTRQEASTEPSVWDNLSSFFGYSSGNLIVEIEDTFGDEELIDMQDFRV